MAKVVFIVDAEIPEEDLNNVWADPAEYLLAGLGSYYGSSDVRVHRIGGVIIKDGWDRFNS